MVAKYAGRLAGVRRGGTRFGRLEGINDMKAFPELLNGVSLLASTPLWSEADTSAMVACVPPPLVVADLYCTAFLYNVLRSRTAAAEHRHPDGHHCPHPCFELFILSDVQL